MYTRLDETTREIVRQLRRRCGWSQAELAGRAGVDEKVIRYVESPKGRKRIQEGTAFRLAEALGISYEQLVGKAPIPDFAPREEGNEAASGEPGTWQERLAGRWRTSRWVRFGAYAFGIVILGAAGATLRIGRPNIEADCYRQFRQGVAHLDRMERVNARRHLLGAIECDTTMAIAWAMMAHPDLYGSIEERNRYIAAALRHVDSASESDRLYIEALVRWNEADIEGAEQTLVRLGREYGDARAYHLLARVHELERDEEAELADLETVRMIDPEDVAALNRLAYLYGRKRQFKKAIETIDRCISYAPQWANPYDTKGDLLALSGRCDEALVAYKRALARQTDFYPALQSVGFLYHLNHDFEEAEEYYVDLMAVKDPAAAARARFFVCCIPIYQGQLQLALKKINDACSADALVGEYGEGYRWKIQARALVQYELGAVHEAVTTYETLFDPEQPYYAPWLSEWTPLYVYLQAHIDPKAAEATVGWLADQVRAEYPATEGYYWLARGMLDLVAGRPEVACDEIEKAYGVEDPFLFDYWVGRAYLDAGRSKEAAQAFERLLARCRGSRVKYGIQGAKAYYYLACAYDALNDFDKARNDYRRFVDLWSHADFESRELARARSRLAELAQIN